MYSSSIEKAIASSKLSYMEKYGFAYESDLNLLEKCLDATVQYSPDRKTARICCSGVELNVQVKPGGADVLGAKSWKNWKKS
jgi:hypothetical protein